MTTRCLTILYPMPPGSNRVCSTPSPHCLPRPSVQRARVATSQRCRLWDHTWPRWASHSTGVRGSVCCCSRVPGNTLRRLGGAPRRGRGHAAQGGNYLANVLWPDPESHSAPPLLPSFALHRRNASAPYAFPEEFDRAAFIAQRGSWNRWAGWVGLGPLVLVLPQSRAPQHGSAGPAS